uniref:MspA protein n=1 Tax=Echinostoma caproni TaxID=27848 RepID=A0A183BH72_9TREM
LGKEVPNLNNGADVPIGGKLNVNGLVGTVGIPGAGTEVLDSEVEVAMKGDDTGAVVVSSLFGPFSLENGTFLGCVIPSSPFLDE